MSFPVPENEEQRLAALESYSILDTISEREYDDLAFLTAHICGTSISTIAFLDKDRKWHKSKYGIDKDSVPREFAICSHTIMGSECLIINDTLEHETFSRIGMVVNPPHVRFYAGVPLISSDGFAIGTLCAIDTEPKQLDAIQCRALKTLAHSVESMLEARRSVLLLEKQQLQLHQHQANIDKLNQALSLQSRTDVLTGLWNRRVQDEVLDRELKRHKRDCQPIGLMMLDIDHFKTVNDQYGHELGDKAIQLVARILAKHTRETDYCIRYGGDEFIVILPNISREFIEATSNRIKSEIESSSVEITVFTVSIGVVVVESINIASDNVLHQVDQCLYLAKSNGRNRVELKFI